MCWRLGHPGFDFGETAFALLQNRAIAPDRESRCALRNHDMSHRQSLRRYHSKGSASAAEFSRELQGRTGDSLGASPRQSSARLPGGFRAPPGEIFPADDFRHSSGHSTVSSHAAASGRDGDSEAVGPTAKGGAGADDNAPCAGAEDRGRRYRLGAFSSIPMGSRFSPGELIGGLINRAQANARMAIMAPVRRG
jgi:hypothetical protein